MSGGTPLTAWEIAKYGPAADAVLAAMKRQGLTKKQVGGALYPEVKAPEKRCNPWITGRGQIPRHKRQALADLLGLDVAVLAPADIEAKPRPPAVSQGQGKPPAARPAPPARALAPIYSPPEVSPLLFEVRPDGMVSIRLNIVTGWEKGTALVRLLLDATDLASLGRT